MVLQHPGLPVADLDHIGVLHGHQLIFVYLEEPVEVTAAEPAQTRDGRSLEHHGQFGF
jgi:hypothetical protein